MKAAEAEERIRLALKNANRQKSSLPKKGRGTTDELVRYLAVHLDNARSIRPSGDYQAKAYNPVKQVIGLINHQFVRYEVPLCLYRALLSHEGIQLIFGEPIAKNAPPYPLEGRYREWFYAVAQGASFAKLVKSVMTKREAHWFLQAPPMNSISTNVLWAKMVAAGLLPVAADFLIERLGVQQLEALKERLPDLVRFYGEAWPQMAKDDRDEITDFVRLCMRNPEFSFKGRTFGSMRKLSTAWHRSRHSVHVGAYVSWSQRFTPWEHRAKGFTIRAEELTSNRGLYQEGHRQRHCVFSYLHRCMCGDSVIVSLRWYPDAVGSEIPRDLNRITIEVSHKEGQIVQIRGACNRRATE